PLAFAGPDFDVSEVFADSDVFDDSDVEASVASAGSDVEASDPEAADEDSSDCADRELERRRPLRERARPLPRSAVSELPSPREWSSVPDRKSTRLNSSHVSISYAVFC